MFEPYAMKVACTVLWGDKFERILFYSTRYPSSPSRKL